jgi:hypothetical protein
MKLIPFILDTDGDADLLIKGNFQGTKIKNKYPHYEVILGFNPATKEFILSKCSCSCWDFKMKSIEVGYLCKHLKTFMKVIPNFIEELE